MFPESTDVKSPASLLAYSLATALIVGIVYITSLSLYRLTFHPLAHYPGPLLAKVTDLHYAYHCWKGDGHLEFHRCHLKYGSAYRYGPNRLSFNTSSALQGIYGFRGNVRKSDFYHAFSLPNSANVFSAISKEQHSRKRRILAHAFSDKALKNMEDYFLMHIRTFCSKLGSAGKPLDMTAWCGCLAFDVMGELCFGKTFGMLYDGKNMFIKGVMDKSAGISLLWGALPILKISGMDKLIFGDMVESKMKYRAFAQAQATERTQVKTERLDFYQYLLSAVDPDTGSGYSTPELWAEANVLIVAGSDTSSNVMAATFFYLLHNPRTLEKATKEVREAFAGEDVEAIRSGPVLNGCHYLRACLDESMRYSPAVPGMLPRTVLPGGTEIDGKHIPSGIEVGIASYALHHNEDCYPDSFQYLPERWIVADDSEKEKVKVEKTQRAFTGFSIGPRACIGRNMAYVEMMITMARVLFQFDMKLASTMGEGGPKVGWGRHRKEEMQLNDHFNGQRKGPMVEFIPIKA